MLNTDGYGFSQTRRLFLTINSKDSSFLLGREKLLGTIITTVAGEYPLLP